MIHPGKEKNGMLRQLVEAVTTIAGSSLSSSSSFSPPSLVGDSIAQRPPPPLRDDDADTDASASSVSWTLLSLWIPSVMAQMTVNQTVRLTTRFIEIFAEYETDITTTNNNNNSSSLRRSKDTDPNSNDTHTTDTHTTEDDDEKETSVSPPPLSWLVDMCGAPATLAGIGSVLQTLTHETVTVTASSPRQRPSVTKQTHTAASAAATLRVVIALWHCVIYGTEPLANETTLSTTLATTTSGTTSNNSSSNSSTSTNNNNGANGSTQPTTIHPTRFAPRTIWRPFGIGTLPPQSFVSPPPSPQMWIVSHLLAMPGLIQEAMLQRHWNESPIPTTTTTAVLFHHTTPRWETLPSLYAILTESPTPHLFHQTLVAAAAAATLTAAAVTVTATLSRPLSTDSPVGSTADTLWSLLVTSILRRPKGDSDVASGLYTHGCGMCDSISPESCGTRLTEHCQIVERTLLTPLPTRDVVLIYRACLLQYLTQKQKRHVRRNKMTHTRGLPLRLFKPDDDDESHHWQWLCTVFQSILPRHCHAICQLVVMSPSSVQRMSSSSSPNQVDGSLCQLLVVMLSQAKVESEYDTSVNADDPENEDDLDADRDTIIDEDEDDDDDDYQRLLRIELRQVPRANRLLYQELCIAAETWATISMIRRWDGFLQQHVTSFLLAGLSELQHKPATTTASKESISREFYQQSLLTARLMQGVTMRLGSSNNESTRRSGMQVGEQIAVLLGLDLKFEELINRDSSESNPTGDGSPATTVSSKIEAHPKPKVIRNLPKFRASDWDPDAVVVENSDSDESHESDATSLSDDDDDSEWDDISSPYDMYDDMADLRDVAMPLYLNECLDYLRTPENDENVYSRHEAALRELPRLVRLRPTDLVDIGPELARSVLRLENKFNMISFTEMVTESLCCITVADPVVVGLNLIAEMFQDSTLSDRLLVLRTLEMAAWELSDVEYYPVTGIISSLPKLPAARVSGKRELVSISTRGEIKESDGRTRRWGKSSSEYTGQKPIVDQFRRVAPTWFYALLSNFLERKEDAVLWGEEVGATLLANVFLALGRIVWHAGPHAPGVDILAKDLFDVVWPFRNAEIAVVRNSVLCATGMVIGSLHEDTVMSLLRDTTDISLCRNLQLITEEDPDSDCRTAAQAVTHALRSTLNTAMLL